MTKKAKGKQVVVVYAATVLVSTDWKADEALHELVAGV